MKPFFKSVLIMGLAAFMGGLSGCFLSSDSKDKDSSATTAAATKNLEAALGSMTDQFQYGKQDLTELQNAYAGYQNALKMNPNDHQARMGAALTGVMLAGQSPQLSSQINSLPVPSVNPLSADFTNQAPLARMAVLRKVAAQWDSVPEFHEIQDAIADTLLPALEEAIVNLEVVYDDPAFSMKLAIDGDSNEIDHAEISVLLAGFKALHALSTLFLSYDYDIDDNGSYTFLDDLSNIGGIDNFQNLTTPEKNAVNHVTSLLTPGSSFLAVRPAWQTKLNGVDNEILDAVNNLKNGLNSISAETDDQTDDIICLRSMSNNDDHCMSDQDLDMIISYQDSGIYYMTHTFSVPVSDTTVQVNLAAFFSVGDYKKLLPYYKFYSSEQWDSLHPVIYFTNAAGTNTGDLNDIETIVNHADSTNATSGQLIASLRGVIHLQDPTFQGFLPGATEDQIWRLFQKELDANGWGDTPTSPILLKQALSPMSPDFALSLLGK